ncbi:MAG: glycosyltransferase, partial [Blastocatellia bacterium]
QYHSTLPPPLIPGSEALYQEITLLQQHFGGQINNLNPKPHGEYVSWRVWGLHQLLPLWRMNRQADLHHVFSAGLFPFPVMRLWTRPIVYTITAGLELQNPPPWRFPARTTITVTNARDGEKLKQWGLAPLIFPPVVDLRSFTYTPAPVSPTFTLLLASAPWTNEQFSSRGIDALLEVVRRESHLRLILLWRGVLFEEITRSVQTLGIGARVEIINEKADVGQLLARANATVLLSASDQGVKAWPHSLIESLAAGKPVLVSRQIPMSVYVNEQQCGVIVDAPEPEQITRALRQLLERYNEYQAAALRTGARDFDLANTLRTWDNLYRTITQ